MDHLGSLGLEGEKCVFINLAALAGPDGKREGLGKVNYVAPVAAAKACVELGFSHWIQSSTQATLAERSGQVPYSRGKAMADFALSRLPDLSVTIATLGLIYCKGNGLVGQAGSGLNLIDLSLLPLTPIMGSGSAPLQPLESEDAADRLAYLALSNPDNRPYQTINNNPHMMLKSPKLRRYDAVGPETMSILEMLSRFARYNGNHRFRPVRIGYRNMEEILEQRSIGNLNRQFISLLKSEQETNSPIVGDHRTFESLLGEDARLMTLEEVFCDSKRCSTQQRSFPYAHTLLWALKNYKVIWPGMKLSAEILYSLATNGVINCDESIKANYTLMKETLPSSILSATTLTQPESIMTADSWEEIDSSKHFRATTSKSHPKLKHKSNGLYPQQSGTAVDVTQFDSRKVFIGKSTNATNTEP
jgi:hypothetical protein